MGNKGFILVLEQLLVLHFNLQIGTMYVEQELYAPSGVCIQNNLDAQN